MKYSVIQELVYCDRPFCLLLENQGKFYIGHFIAYAGDYERWFMHGIEKEMLEKLLRGEIDLISTASVSEKYMSDFIRTEECLEKSHEFRDVPKCGVKWTVDVDKLSAYLPSSGFYFFKGEFSEARIQEIMKT